MKIMEVGLSLCDVMNNSCCSVALLVGIEVELLVELWINKKKTYLHIYMYMYRETVGFPTELPFLAKRRMFFWGNMPTCCLTATLVLVSRQCGFVRVASVLLGSRILVG